MTYFKHNIFALPIFSFFSAPKYQEVAYKWSGSNLAYLFLLLSACCLIPTILLQNKAKQESGSSIAHIVEQLPDLHIRDGLVISQQQRPFQITNHTGRTFAIIDTTGSMNYIYDPDVYMLLTRKQLLVRYGPDEEDLITLGLQNIKKIKLNKQHYIEAANIIETIFFPAVYGTILTISFLSLTLLCGIGSLFARAICASRNTKLNLKALLRVSATAMTPSILLVTLATALGIWLSPLLYLVFILLYLLIGTHASLTPPEPEHSKVDLLASLH